MSATLWVGVFALGLGTWALRGAAWLSVRPVCTTTGPPLGGLGSTALMVALGITLLRDDPVGVAGLVAAVGVVVLSAATGRVSLAVGLALGGLWGAGRAGWIDSAPTEPTSLPEAHGPAREPAR